MATASLLALLDDITSVLDDVALLSKLAAKKTAGVLGDDLALNAQQVAGVQAERELPVVWAVAKGSLVNKAILVPAALLISAVAAWAITPLLMIGGLYLCFEGFEKLWHHFGPQSEYSASEQGAAQRQAQLNSQADPQTGTRADAPANLPVEGPIDVAAFERDKIRGAIRTDFILSAEIIAIALGTVADQPLLSQAMVLSLVAVVMTLGVYGFVAAIVKMDDLGLLLCRSTGIGAIAGLGRWTGAMLLQAAPWLMRGLSVAGTAAMFLVGGGILAHGLPVLHHAIESLGESLGGGALATGLLMLGQALLGIVAGALVLAVVQGWSRLHRSA